ncbi:MAG: endonuclease/exonuclease/phosphatase family protein [Planctomycetota bacterium]
MRFWHLYAAGLALTGLARTARGQEAVPMVRFATFNVALNRPHAGDLARDLRAGSAQAHAVAEIVQRARPDVLLLNEFDWDAEGAALAVFRADYLGKAHGDAQPISFEHAFVAAVNTGEPSGLDLDRDGKTDGAGDAFGYGAFPGQYGMVVLSRLPIARTRVRTFRSLLWKDMPDAWWPDDPHTDEPADWYGAPARDAMRLSSKSHWDIPIEVGSTCVHLLASHPTPPVFDGPEDRNGKRNHDEIRLWADYVDAERSAWIRDDAGQRGGLAAGEHFVVAGDLNADPSDGDGPPAIDQLLEHARIDASLMPRSAGGIEAAKRQGGANTRQRGDPGLDTGDFADSSVGNLHLDYVLPSRGLQPWCGGVFWPRAEEPLFALVGDGDPVVSSDHRLVWLDVSLPRAAALVGQPFDQLGGGQPGGARFLEPFAFADHELTLVRWWTEGCPFCAATLPALEELRQRFATRGLAVVGMYHPKPIREVDDNQVRAFATERGFGGPVAADARWQKLADLRARGAPEAATSISILVNRAGTIVWVHPGPRLHPSTDPAHGAAARAHAELLHLLSTTLR